MLLIVEPGTIAWLNSAFKTRQIARFRRHLALVGVGFAAFEMNSTLLSIKRVDEIAAAADRKRQVVAIIETCKCASSLSRFKTLSDFATC